MSTTNHSAATTTAPHRKNAALPIRSESPYQGRTAQKDNPTQAIIRQSVDFLIQQVQEGKSETLTAYLAAMSRFRNYSLATSLPLHGRSPLQPALPVTAHGRNLAGL